MTVHRFTAPFCAVTLYVTGTLKSCAAPDSGETEASAETVISGIRADLSGNVSNGYLTTTVAFALSIMPTKSEETLSVFMAESPSKAASLESFLNSNVRISASADCTGVEAAEPEELSSADAAGPAADPPPPPPPPPPQEVMRVRPTKRNKYDIIENLFIPTSLSVYFPT